MSGVLADKIALVTGARGGIGRAICERFKREGATVIACDLNEQGSMQKSYNVTDHFIAMDVSNEQNVISVMQEVKSIYGMLHILVNAAGIEIEQSIENTTLEQWNQTFAINVTGTFLVSKYSLPLLRESVEQLQETNKAGASIINFGSYDGFIADPQLAAYCASKGAVHALTKAMACDHGPENIRVNAVCPGYVNTPMLQSFFNGEGSGAGGQSIKSLQQAVRDVHPLRTYGEPEDIANMVNWLASDESRYASGQLFVIDGGLSAQVQQMKL